MCFSAHNVFQYSCCSLTDLPEGPPPIRLVGGTTSFNGRVEVYIQNQWGTICDDSWSQLDAQVVCRQLGFSANGATASGQAVYGQGTGPIVLDNVNCNGLEAYITDCQHNGLYVHNCQHAEDAGVSCSGENFLIFSNCLSHIHSSSLAPAQVFQYPVRLLINSSVATFEGRVQIRYNNTWGEICGNSWDYPDAQVVCHMLGYNNAIRAWNTALFGVPSSTNIWLDHVQCTGTETDIVDCFHGSWGSHTCSNTNIAGVSCTSEYMNVCIMVFCSIAGWYSVL